MSKGLKELKKGKRCYLREEHSKPRELADAKALGWKLLEPSWNSEKARRWSKAEGGEEERRLKR